MKARLCLMNECPIGSMKGWKRKACWNLQIYSHGRPTLRSNRIHRPKDPRRHGRENLPDVRQPREARVQQKHFLLRRHPEPSDALRTSESESQPARLHTLHVERKRTMTEDQQQNKMPDDYGQQLTGCIVEGLLIAAVFIIAAILSIL